LQRYRTGAEGRISHLKRATACDAAGAKAMTARKVGRAGRSWPTTSTPETLTSSLARAPSIPPTAAPPTRPSPFSRSTVIRGK
jgi:hypothetical protein